MKDNLVIGSKSLVIVGRRVWAQKTKWGEKGHCRVHATILVQLHWENQKKGQRDVDSAMCSL